MGWYYPFGASRKSLIAQLVEDREKDRAGADGLTIRTQSIASCFRGAVTHKGILWTVWERTFTNLDGSENRPSERFLGCDLMECSTVDGERSWGYKPMDESCGPCYWNCPEKYLKMVPVVADQEWRDGVAEYHTQRRARLAARRLVA